jgi:hypothetical protein
MEHLLMRLNSFSHRDIALSSLRLERSTYERDPLNTEERDSFESFKTSFDLNSKAEDICSLLSDERVAAFYEELGLFLRLLTFCIPRNILVPRSISREEFWVRYFYREWDFEQREETRKAIIKGRI